MSNTNKTYEYLDYGGLQTYHTELMKYIDTGIHKMRFMGAYDRLPDDMLPLTDTDSEPYDEDIKRRGIWYNEASDDVEVEFHEGDIIIIGGCSQDGLVGESVIQANHKTYMLVFTYATGESVSTWDWVLLAGGSNNSNNNPSTSTPINPGEIDADTLDGKHADEFAPTSHASAATTYGVATTSNYGHVKILNGDISPKTHQNGVAAGLGHTHSKFDNMVCFNNNIHLCNNQDIEGGAIYFGDGAAHSGGESLVYIKEESDDILEVCGCKQLRLIGAYDGASIVIGEGEEDDMGVDYIGRISINAPDGLYINGKKYNQSSGSTDSSLVQKIQNLADEIRRLRIRVSYLESQIGSCDGDCPGDGCDEDWCFEEIEPCYPDNDGDGLQDGKEDDCVGDWEEDGCDDMDDDGIQDSF